MKNKDAEDIVIPKPVILDETNKRTGPLKLFKKNIQSYWDAKHLFYMHKWLDKTGPELLAAQKDKSLTNAEYMIIKFLITTINNPYPSLIKMVLEMSAGKKGMGGLPPEEEERGARTIKRIILQLPKSKRIDESRKQSSDN